MVTGGFEVAIFFEGKAVRKFLEFFDSKALLSECLSSGDGKFRGRPSSDASACNA
jgi:hypothetical protein